MNWQTKQAKQNLSKLTPVQRWKEFERLLTEGAKAKGWSVNIQRVFGGKASSCWFYGDDFTAGQAVEVSDSLVLCAPDPAPLVNATLWKVALSMTPGLVPDPPPPVTEFVPPPGAHMAGEMHFTLGGEVWLCSAPGIPGTWTKVSNPAIQFVAQVDTTAYQEVLKKAAAQFVPPQFLASSWNPFASPPLVGHPTVSALAEIVPTISTATARCPQCPAATTEMPLAHAIVHLNDHHHWTREQVADWLDLLDVDLSIRQKEVA